MHAEPVPAHDRMRLERLCRVRRQKTIAAGFMHLESVDYRDVEVLKAQDTFREGSDFGCPPLHQILIRAS